jgi:DNA invertase Pin-like site-specific DNA recombinase
VCFAFVEGVRDISGLGIEFVSLTEGVDTSTPAGKMVFTILGAVAELGRSLIRERVRAELQNAKAKGKLIGRPRVKADIAHILDLRAQGAIVARHRRKARAWGGNSSEARFGTRQNPVFPACRK